MREHSQLQFDDDGAWGCAACSRRGSSYTLPSRQPCLPRTADEQERAGDSEALEETLTALGIAPPKIDAIFESEWLLAWIVQAEAHSSRPFSSWLVAPLPNESRPIDALLEGNEERAFAVFANVYPQET